ncbi:MAG: 30S ribosomal protein S12 methylthiotransferase RimO [Candidatus Omnitrophota bacterium]
MPIKVSLISLGCARNLVDSEVMLGFLEGPDFKIVSQPAKSDVAIVNTCAFIEDAKKESIKAILDLVDLKRNGRIKKILVAGCLAQRYGAALREELKEADGFVGVDALPKIARIIKELLRKGRVCDLSARPVFLYDEKSPRFFLTPRHYAYIKISEGCSHRCSFCVIPDIRGLHRSRAEGSILKEAGRLIKRGVKEINLIGQDTTLYGMDLYGRFALASLLKKLAKIKGAGWIRLLYAHPAHFTDELIGVIRDEPVVCRYIDLPIQHINDRILKDMGRGASKRSILSLLDKLRKQIPGVAIRTSIIVGFPGETMKEFSELLNFIKDQRFARLGAFMYSREEATPAYNFPRQISEEEKTLRWNEIMKIQREISNENNRELIGKRIDVIIDEKDASGSNIYLGRSYMDAPEVDGIVYIKTAKGEALNSKLKIGDFSRVKIIDAYEYDLVGEVTGKKTL